MIHGLIFAGLIVWSTLKIVKGGTEGVTQGLVGAVVVLGFIYLLAS